MKPLIPAKKARRLLGGISQEAFVRYATKGANGRRLDACKVGNRWFCTEEAIEAFIWHPPPAPSALPVEADAVIAQLETDFGF